MLDHGDRSRHFLAWINCYLVPTVLNWTELRKRSCKTVRACRQIKVAIYKANKMLFPFQSFKNIKDYIDYAKGSQDLSIVAGGKYDDRWGSSQFLPYSKTRRIILHLLVQSYQMVAESTDRENKVSGNAVRRLLENHWLSWDIVATFHYIKTVRPKSCRYQLTFGTKFPKKKKLKSCKYQLH